MEVRKAGLLELHGIEVVEDRETLKPPSQEEP